jgi:hypothetical protein
MRLVAILALVSAAYAASPEDAYFAARDKAIARVKALTAANADDAKIEAVQTAALADLQKRLLVLVGPSSVKGFSPSPKINPETLADEPGFGMLDGLAYAAAGKRQDGSRLVATTKPLLAAWLRARAAESDASARAPAEMETALRSNNFYTFAVGSDAAFTRVVEIEVVKPSGAEFAVAALGRWSQDIGPSPLDRLVVAVVKGGHAFVADVEPAAKAPEFPACKAVWDAASAKADKITEDLQKGGAKDDAMFEQSTKAQQQGEAEWLACAGHAAKTAAFYPRLKQEAQDLVDR